jgi:hypothetical protein
LLNDVRVIEDLRDDEARRIIQEQLKLSKKLSKRQMRQFFQERLASDNTGELGAGFQAKAKALLEALRSRLNA